MISDAHEASLAGGAQTPEVTAACAAPRPSPELGLARTDLASPRSGLPRPRVLCPGDGHMRRTQGCPWRLPCRPPTPRLSAP